MSPEELRLECLKLALANHKPGEAVETAADFARFVIDGDEKPAPVKADEGRWVRWA